MSCGGRSRRRRRWRRTASCSPDRWRTTRSGYDVDATAAERAARPAGSEAFFDRGPGYARLAGGSTHAEVDAAMRVLLALGGNAMTNAEGRARVEDQIAAARIAMESVADLVAEDIDVVADPWQRATGGQPAGEERAGRGRRTSCAAGLVRRADPGNPRLRADERARLVADEAGDRPAQRHRGHPDAGRRRRPRVQPADQADRAVPRRGRGSSADRPRRDLGGPGREGLAADGRLTAAPGDRRRAGGRRPDRCGVRGRRERRRRDPGRAWTPTARWKASAR